MGTYFWNGMHTSRWTNKTTYFSSYITIDWNCVLWLIIDWLLCCLTSYSRIFHHYRDAIITWESCTIYALVWLWTTLEHTTGIFIVSYLLWHGTSVFNVSPYINYCNFKCNFTKDKINTRSEMHQLSFWPHHQFETVKLACCVEREGRIYPISSLYNPKLCFTVVVKMSGRLFMFYARTIIDFSQYSSGSLVN